EMHDGILWVYVQNGAKTVDIMRDGFHTIRRYNLETTLQPGKVYDMVLKPEPKVISMQNLLFVVEPANSKAMIMYTDESGEEKLFGQVDEEGCAYKKLVLGKYFYKIISENYHTSEGVVTLSTPSGKHTETVTLRPNFSNITLTVEGGAEIYINDEKQGTGQWSGNLPHGTYSVECRKANHKSTLETITVEDGKNTIYTLKAPTPIVGSLSISSTPLRAQISIDGKAVGETPEMIDGLIIGNHKVTISKDGYETATADVAIKENETTEHNVELKKIESPVPVVSKGNAKNSGNGNTAISGNTFTVNGVSFTMIPVKGGTFKMGATREQKNIFDDENPVHRVTLSDYYIAETEVTQALWQAVMGSNPSDFKGKNNPVEQVSYNDCITFIEKLNTLLANQLPAGKKFRLPTEAEWEYAARGGSQSKGYQYSGSNTLNDVAWYDSNSGRKTHPVKQKQPNELGIYDMSGNVCEWCSDWYGSYSSSAQTNPTGPSSGSNRVLRGGSWGNYAQYCRVAIRYCMTPGFCFNNNGLRLALDGATAAVGVTEQHNVLSARSKAMSAPKTSAPYKVGDYYNDG
ncbi:MAG: SUMF1/EgtB/PvdO family nonheme iron enzyme, partial [Bacteroidaceae bacterium]|nr:SUMF1/EgtB/PvdO family nonheme iron enzyme [Bacteroidaceae bacterium]